MKKKTAKAGLNLSLLHLPDKRALKAYKAGPHKKEAEGP
jgi:hypothetical protein